jgi:hypothetical protein
MPNKTGTSQTSKQAAALGRFAGFSAKGSS